jgi:hypothetical protein
MCGMTMIRPSLRIDVTATATGARISLPEEPALLADFQTHFPRARRTKSPNLWQVAGSRATLRLQQWASDQQSWLQLLEQRERDLEWTAPPIVKPRGPAKFRAIPSRFAQALPPPDGATEAALAAIERLDQQIADLTPFGFLDCWLSGSAWNGIIMTTVHPALTQRGVSPACIDWRWTVLWSGDGWADHGWLPCENALALKDFRRVWRAMNPDRLSIR